MKETTTRSKQARVWDPVPHEKNDLQQRIFIVKEATKGSGPTRYELVCKSKAT
jgi:hypothetical protein